MKKIFAMLIALLMISSGSALAQTVDAQTLAMQAVAAELPGAELNYTILDRDDGRLEWEVFYRQGTTLGVCYVDNSTYAVRRTKAYSDMPADALTADAAIARLAELKGQLVVVDLDLERDDGEYWYEGEAELDGRRYEFEMTVSGEIYEWERD